MVTTISRETSERFRLAQPIPMEALALERDQLFAALKRFQEALEDIAAFPCASDLPLCHNPGCASCRAARALARPATGGEPSHPVCPPNSPLILPGPGGEVAPKDLFFR
jgi:hypothetical protein